MASHSVENSTQILSYLDPPRVKQVHEERRLQGVDPAADVVVPQHDEALAQLEARPAPSRRRRGLLGLRKLLTA